MSGIPAYCAHGVPMDPAASCPDCERIFGYSVMTEEQRRLARFYNVNTKDDIIAAQAHHIERLQAKLPPLPDMRPVRVREG